MGYAVEPGDNAGTAFDRILDEELKAVRDELRGAALGNPDAVHNYRRHLKKARSLVRMARYALRDWSMRDIGRELGEATRLFASWREREALQESLERLASDGTGTPAGLLWERTQALMKNRFEEDSTDPARDNAAAKAESLLGEVQASLKFGRPEAPPITAFCRGVGRSYGQARKSMKRAFTQRDPEVLHEWRKYSKHLRHQVQILSAAWPACFEAMESELHRLTDALGAVHDLALLRQFLLETPPEGLDAAELAIMAGAIEGTVGAEKERAFDLGALLFSEDLGAFRKRIRKYVESWESGLQKHSAP